MNEFRSQFRGTFDAEQYTHTPLGSATLQWRTATRCPQPELLDPEHFSRIADLLRSDADPTSIRHAAQEIQAELNPHSAGQTTLNMPRIDDSQRAPSAG